MARWFLTLACILPLVAWSCVAPETTEYGGVTGSDEEFKLKYPDLSYSYFDDVVEVEMLAVKGDKLYDSYYKKKDEKQQIDEETRRYAVETYMRAINASMRIYKDTGAYSILRIQRDVSSRMQDLLREVERAGGTPAPTSPK